MSRLSTLDERLNGARWYGSDLAYSQIFFSTVNDILTIRDVNNGKGLASNIYTKKYFIPTETSEGNDSIIEWLEQYANKKTEKSKEWRVKYIDLIHTSVMYSIR